MASSLVSLFAPVGLSLSTGSSAPAGQVPVFLGMWGVHCSTDDSGTDGCDGDFYDPADVAVSEGLPSVSSRRRVVARPDRGLARKKGLASSVGGPGNELEQWPAPTAPHVKEASRWHEVRRTAS
jgi:hypothetical protein